MNSSKKKILIINSYFEIGGIESALINMANELVNYYDVDLLIYNPKGPMKDRLDSRVNILKSSFALKAMGMSMSEALHSKNILIILFRIFCFLWSHLFDNRFPIFIATKLQKKLKGYDLAIAYRAETRKKMVLSGYARILDKCVESKTKVVWIHYDAEHYKEHYSFNVKYYEKLDKIIGVSKSVAEKFKTANPSLADKTDYCYHFMNYNDIENNSKKEQAVKYPEDKFICFSASRLSEEKGIIRAVSALSPILKEHSDVMWYIAGDGTERKNIEQLIKQEGLEERIVLLGNQSNPYPYMKNADLYLSLSYHEAAPVVYLEAKSLQVPVFSTETSSSYEMLKDGEEDFICENSEEGIKEKFGWLMNNRNLIENAKKNLSECTADNREALFKINELVESVQ